jgi:hypothetical protein
VHKVGNILINQFCFQEKLDIKALPLSHGLLLKLVILIITHRHQYLLEHRNNFEIITK